MLFLQRALHLVSEGLTRPPAEAFHPSFSASYKTKLAPPVCRSVHYTTGLYPTLLESYTGEHNAAVSPMTNKADLKQMNLMIDRGLDPNTV